MAAPYESMFAAEAKMKAAVCSHVIPTDSRVVPKGMTEAQFDLALDELELVVGNNAVSRNAPDLYHYHDPWHLGNESKHLPGGAVRPASVEEVQGVLKIANEHKLPLWTISRGKNYGYGGMAPVAAGSVVLDLSRMNRILEADEEQCYAIVEPGVTFYDLYNYIHEHKLNLWMSCPALGWGSVIGNTLDKGFGYIATGEHTAMQCGMEVVLPDGQLLRTGMGALPNSRTWASYKSGYGPIVDGLFFQSNLGIVTKLGIWLQPAPQAFMTCAVSVEREEQIVELTSTITDLQRKGIIQNSPSISNLFRQCITQIEIPEVAQLLVPCLGTKDAIPDEKLEHIQKKMGWGFWIADFALYGPTNIVHASWEHIQSVFAKVVGAQCTSEIFSAADGEKLSATTLPHQDIPQSGTPHVANIRLMDYRGEAGHTCFSPIITSSGKDVYDWYLTAKQRTIDAGFDFFADFHLYPHYVIAIELVVYARDEAERMDNLYCLLADDASKQGYSEYRTHVKYMDLISGHFSFNDFALKRFVSRLKDELDPNGILSPGKQGIWGCS